MVLKSRPRSRVIAPPVRCLTRATKNAIFLKERAPEVFDADESAEGFGTGVPLSLLQVLHRLPYHSPLLDRHPQVREILRTVRPPVPGRGARTALFTGTVHFAQVTFQTNAGNIVTSTADMNQIVQYAQHAAVSIAEYAGQYGPCSVHVSPTVLTHTVNVPTGSYTKADLKGWVNQIASDNSLPGSDCVFVISPQGLASTDVGDNAGYHGVANLPFIVSGVWHSNLTLADNPDVYAMVVSHEIAELVVDPRLDPQNPEVCDPCDLNCNNLTRCYFDASDNFLGSNQQSPPGGFTFTYYTCAVVKPNSATACPAPSADCQYAPVIQDIQLLIDKSTYSQDEVGASNSFPAAYWVAADGFTTGELGFNAPADLSNPNPAPAPVPSVTIDAALNPSLTAAQIATIAANLPSVSQLAPPVVATDPTLALVTQRLLYPHTVSFANNQAFAALQLDQAAVLTLSASLTVGQVTQTASGTLELIKGENPYMTSVNPADPTQPAWLAFDLRLFKVAVPSGGTASRFGATMSSDAAAAPGFIASVLTNLDMGAGTAGGETFEGLAQDEQQSAIEYLRQDSAGNFVFNFAVARVRLRGNTPGAQATAVRVFFRMFQVQSAGTAFNEATTYRFGSDGVLNGHKAPLMGVQNDAGGNPEFVTMPFFASPRVNLLARADMNGQNDPPNVANIPVNPGVEVDTYFGCWLDANQPQQQWMPQTPPAGNFDGPWNGLPLVSINQGITRGTHQCLIAEIRYDDAPVPGGVTPGGSDKLAQRNIAWIDGPNPGSPESRIMPHPFELYPSDWKVSSQSEMMVLWKDTPIGSRASFFLPAASASDIVAAADRMYVHHQLAVEDANTISSPADGGGVTFLPVPFGSARLAGLMTVALPAGIHKGDRYAVEVRELTPERLVPPPPVVIIGRTNGHARADNSLNWRRTTGGFEFAMNISTKAQILPAEERLLSWGRWLFESIPQTSRWRPVWARYLDQISQRLLLLGGNPADVLPSPTGTGVKHAPVPKPQTDHDQEHGIELSGKVEGLYYDRFGDFEGFSLESERGQERRFRSREHRIEHLVKSAWAERLVVTVITASDRPDVPATVVLRRGPEPFQH